MEPPSGVTVIAHHRVRVGHEQDFEAALREFMNFAFAFPGQQGITVVRPPANEQDYTMVARFADVAARRSFVAAPAYAQFRQRMDDFSEGAPLIEELTGLETWFTLPEAPYLPPPPRWKMAVTSFLGVFPTTALLGPLLAEAFKPLPHLLVHAIMIAITAAVLTWGVMPSLTRLLKHWLYPEHPSS